MRFAWLALVVLASLAMTTLSEVSTVPLQIEAQTIIAYVINGTPWEFPTTASGFVALAKNTTPTGVKNVTNVGRVELDEVILKMYNIGNVPINVSLTIDKNFTGVNTGYNFSAETYFKVLPIYQRDTEYEYCSGYHECVDGGYQEICGNKVSNTSSLEVADFMWPITEGDYYLYIGHNHSISDTSRKYGTGVALPAGIPNDNYTANLYIHVVQS